MVNHVVACMRITGADTRVKSRLDWCAKCKFPISVALSTPVHANATYLCMSCVPWDEVEQIADITDTQVADIEDYRRRRGKSNDTV
jgi:hypothetical protein